MGQKLTYDDMLREAEEIHEWNSDYCSNHQNINKTSIVLASCPGDIIHEGHLSYLQSSKYPSYDLVARPIQLFVIVNGNAFLERKKGYYAVDEETRASIIAALEYVDYAAVFHDDGQTVARAIREIRPHFFTNGGDRGEKTAVTDEVEAANDVGCKLLYGIGGTEKVNSSSDIIERIKKQIIREIDRNHF